MLVTEGFEALDMYLWIADVFPEHKTMQMISTIGTTT